MSVVVASLSLLLLSLYDVLMQLLYRYVLSSSLGTVVMEPHTANEQ